MDKPKFARPTSSLNKQLRSGINEYFEQQNLPRTGNNRLYIKAGILVAALITVYIHLVFFTPFYWIAIPECILLGVLTEVGS